MIYEVTRVMVMVLFVLTRGIISHLLQSGGISGPGEGGIIHTRCVDNRWDLLRLYKSGSLPVILDSKSVFN